MEFPRLGVKSELQPSAYATATATEDLSCVCKLHHSSQQQKILNPLGKARDQTRNLMVTSQIHFLCATRGTLALFFIFPVHILHVKTRRVNFRCCPFKSLYNMVCFVIELYLLGSDTVTVLKNA